MKNKSSYIYPQITIKILHALQDEGEWQKKNDIDKFLDSWGSGRQITYAKQTWFAKLIVKLLIEMSQIEIITEKLYPNSVLHDVYRLSLSHARSMIQDMVIRPYSGKYNRKVINK